MVSEDKKPEIQDARSPACRCRWWLTPDQFITNRIRREGKATAETKEKLSFNRGDQRHSVFVLWLLSRPTFAEPI